MCAARTTPITVTYVFPDGRRVPLGEGVIDDDGRIDVTRPAAGQEAYVAEAMAELNARDYVILKEPPTADMPQFALQKRKITRDSPEFLSALRDYGMRVYSMDFAFDATAIQPAADAVIVAATTPVPAPEDDADAPRSAPEIAPAMEITPDPDDAP